MFFMIRQPLPRLDHSPVARPLSARVQIKVANPKKLVFSPAGVYGQWLVVSGVPFRA